MLLWGLPQRLFLIWKDHVDLKDLGSLVKKSETKCVSESENSSTAFLPSVVF